MKAQVRAKEDLCVLTRNHGRISMRILGMSVKDSTHVVLYNEKEVVSSYSSSAFLLYKDWQ